MAFEVAALLLALGTFASFTWAVRRLFVAADGMRPGMRAIAAGGLASMVAHTAALATAEAAGPLAGVGLALYGLSLSLFWSAAGVTASRPLTLAFSGDRPAHLVTAGPYARIRHPFYTAYLLAWIAGTLASGQPALLVTVVGMGALYVRAARLEEAKFAESLLAADYARYRAATGLFWPGPGLGRASPAVPFAVVATPHGHGSADTQPAGLPRRLT